MRDALYLAWCYLLHNRWKTTLLTASITLILFLPAALHVAVGQAAGLLTTRAEETPLLLGPRGSSVDLALAALYFRDPALPPFRYRHVQQIAGEGTAQVIPLHLRFTVGEQRIVGTTPEYLAFRSLRVRQGRTFALLGEAVLGSTAAERLDVREGDSVISTPAGAFDVAGTFPLRMNVVGVLEATGTADDDAVFVDLKTAWAIEGIAHGHEDVTANPGSAGSGAHAADTDPAAPEAETPQADTTGPPAIIAEPTLLPYTEITPENLASFHFHGDQGDYPVDAAIVLPADARAGVMLQGRYPVGEGEVQLVPPADVIDDLVQTMFSLRAVTLVLSTALALATILTSGLVFALSIRIRARELETMRRIGAREGVIRTVLALEIAAVLVASIVLAAGLTALVGRFGDRVFRFVVA